MKLNFRIVRLDDDYSPAIIGRNKRDDTWIMARRPSISHEDSFNRVPEISVRCCDTSKLKLVWQQWDAAQLEDDYAALALT